jgi:tetratricopeptide (TPR) repeat protein
MRRVFIILAVALATPAAAQPDDKAKQAEARRLYDEGKKHYDLAEYAKAIAAWKQSYLLSSAPRLLFNLGQAYRLSGDCTQAMRFYNNYLRAEPKPDNKRELDRVIALCAAGKGGRDPGDPKPPTPTAKPIERPDQVDPAPARAEPAKPDEAVQPGSPRAKELARTLASDGVAALEAKQYQRALDAFDAAYQLYPSARLLLNMATTLRDMGRLSDAADHYQLFLEAPDTEPAAAAEARRLLNDLDRSLYLLTVRVMPRGGDVSIDGGPWISVGEKKLMLRLSPQIHMLRGRKLGAGYAVTELTINGFEGEKNDVELVLKVDVPDEKPTPAPAGEPAIAAASKPEIENAVDAGGATRDGATVIARMGVGVKSERGGIAYKSSAVVRNDDDEIIAVVPVLRSGARNRIGATAQLRIDGKGRGAAAAFGLTFSPRVLSGLEMDMLALVSNDLGGYLGMRYRLLPGRFRPLIGGGFPVFYSYGAPRLGIRGSVGLELVISGNLAVVGEIGAEHFFNNPEMVIEDGIPITYEADAIIPVVALFGRL